MTEANKRIVRRLIEEIYNDANMAAFDELVSAEIVDHDPPPAGNGEDSTFKEAFERFRAAFPDMRYDIEEMVAEGDRVAVRGTFTGSQQGDFMGIPASGSEVTVAFIDMVRLAEGKAVERWGLIDRLGMMHQLNVGPTGGVGG